MYIFVQLYLSLFRNLNVLLSQSKGQFLIGLALSEQKKIFFFICVLIIFAKRWFPLGYGLKMRIINDFQTADKDYKNYRTKEGKESNQRLGNSNYVEVLKSQTAVNRRNCQK